MERYLLKDGKKLRYGYTTGSCAAAASKAATFMLYTGVAIDRVEIDTPKGWRLSLDVLDVSLGKDYARCGIKKDGGDDPDVTNGLVVYATAERAERGIEVRAGEGIGTVTKPGLQVAPGNPAINPVPMEMIFKEVKEVLPPDKGVVLTLSIPGGDKVAQKTYNPRLGIVGGLSILGTTGIVEPMSEEALKESLALELSVISRQGNSRVVLVPGNYGRDYAVKMGYDDRIIVSYGNYLGFMLDKSVEYGFKKVLLIGHIGKLIKASAGIFNTHSRIADARAEIMTAYAAYLGAKHDAIKELLHTNTSEDALDVLDRYGLDLRKYGQLVADRIKEKCEGYTYGALEVDVVLFSLKWGLLARSPMEVQV